MSKEKINLSHEYTHDPESMAEIRAEKTRELHEKLKDSAETKPENTSELTRKAFETAASTEKEKKNEITQESSAERRISGPNKAAKEASFTSTMKEVRSQMSTPSKAFSKVIHNKTVEKVSDGVGNTLARPNAILSGAIFAFVLTLGVYLIAKNLGYPLSGFETIAAFLLGWALGVIYDFLKIMITGRK